MKKLFVLALAIISFSANANEGHDTAIITTEAFKGDNLARVHKNYHHEKSGEFFNVVYLIHPDSTAEQPIMDIIITTKNGQLAINQNSSTLIGDFDFSGIKAKSLTSALKEELFFSDPLFDGFIKLNKQLGYVLNNYTAGECNDLSNAIDAALAYYMYLRRVSDDESAINSFRGLLMGMIMEYHSNC